MLALLRVTPRAAKTGKTKASTRRYEPASPPPVGRQQSRRRCLPWPGEHLEPRVPALAPPVLGRALEVHRAHGGDVKAVVVGRPRSRAEGGALQGIVGGGQGELELAEQIDHDEPHLHLGKVAAEARPRGVREGGEPLRLWADGGAGAADPGKLLGRELPVRVEVVCVGAPQVRVPVARPVHDLHQRPAWERHRPTVRPGDGVVELELPVGAAGDRRPQAEHLGDAAVQKRQVGQVPVLWLAAGQAAEEAVDLATELGLVRWVPRQLEDQPCHGVARCVVAREEGQQHVAVVRGRREVARRHRPGQGGPDGAAVAGQREGRIARSVHERPHRLAEHARLGVLVVARKGRPELGVRGLHEALWRAQEGQLQLGLRFVQQEVAHVDWLGPSAGRLGQPLCALLGTGQRRGQDGRQRAQRKKRLREVRTLLAPVVVVGRGDDAVEQRSLEVALLADVQPRDAPSVAWICDDHPRSDAEVPASAHANPVHDGHGDVAGEAPRPVL
mmetsp:Transcript_50027/g.134614  ORF Transcript_50027/g.134614 Transcript_50027/m.134614 type:complete len:501 (+) Transcript_50027:256-1758(+)